MQLLPLQIVSKDAHADSLPLVSCIASDRQTCIVPIQDCWVLSMKVLDKELSVDMRAAHDIQQDHRK